MLPIIANINGIDMVRLRDAVLTAPVFGSVPGDYPWDRWEKAALQAGLALGRDHDEDRAQHGQGEDEGQNEAAGVHG